MSVSHAIRLLPANGTAPPASRRRSRRTLLTENAELRRERDAARAANVMLARRLGGRTHG
jgi:hypothetical protein